MLQNLYLNLPPHSVFESLCFTKSFAYAGSCYVKDNMDWKGADKYNQANVISMEDCQNICKDKRIQNFVWVRIHNRCVCKDAVSGENTNTCCMSGHAFGGTCEGELTYIHYSKPTKVC